VFTSKNRYSSPVLLVLPRKEGRIEQVVKTYEIPETRDEELVFNRIIQKIEEGDIEAAIFGDDMIKHSILTDGS
jgi:hypothetical protein